MKILIVGGGGREHAIAWKIAQSPKVTKIFCAPGNGGMKNIVECVPINANNIENLSDFAQKNKIDLTVVGPELPLTLGIVDKFREKDLKIFGPIQRASEIEGSKVFAKNFMKKHGIPTAPFYIFNSIESALSHIENTAPPFVIKADGLAAGKGVIPVKTRKEAEEAIKLIMIKKAFGDAGNKVIIEDFLTGEEISFIVFTDGKDILPLPASQDHKPIFDGDKGPNTGGMGAYSPAPLITKGLSKDIISEIFLPAVHNMASENRIYKGVLYGGLMLEGERVKVLEFNARFGDPETQPLLMLMKSDIIPVLESVIEGRLENCRVEWEDKFAVCVVMAQIGYPESYDKGNLISGIQEAESIDNVKIFHSGTAFKDGKFYTAGGRVLGVTALGDSIGSAIELAYHAVGMISWDGAYYRKDIGRSALNNA
ncbi:MAG: phosphoribosylamine--glycine ligase [Thermodesulfobacteriota bacterium]|nr:phosphoribosylamine--glycine ligase [Thermodesulfobacteriota bacterium]